MDSRVRSACLTHGVPKRLTYSADLIRLTRAQSVSHKPLDSRQLQGSVCAYSEHFDIVTGYIAGDLHIHVPTNRSLVANVMTSSVSEEKRSDPETIDFWSSHPINWPALYAVGALMLTVVGVSLWMGDYGSAANTALILAGGALLAYGNVRKQIGKEAWRRWRWAGLGMWGLLACWNLIRIAKAWLAHGG